MEKDVSGIDDLQASYDETVIKLSNAEIQIEDLKLQLDDALAAEDMLVRLTERNLVLGEVKHLYIYLVFIKKFISISRKSRKCELPSRTSKP